MLEKQVVDAMLTKEQEINSKFHFAISEVMRVGADTVRGRQVVKDLIKSVQYTLDDLDNVHNNIVR